MCNSCGGHHQRESEPKDTDTFNKSENNLIKVYVSFFQVFSMLIFDKDWACGIWSILGSAEKTCHWMNKDFPSSILSNVFGDNEGRDESHSLVFHQGQMIR